MPVGPYPISVVIFKHPANRSTTSDNSSTDPLSKSFSSSAAFSSADSTKPLLMGVSLSVPPPRETGPFIGLDLVNAVSFDCFANTSPPHPAVHLPNVSGNLESNRDPLTLTPPTYQDADGQAAQFQDVVTAWRKSADGAVEDAVKGMTSALGFSADNVRATKMMEFAQTLAPPEQVLRTIDTTYVVPPMVNKGSG